MFRPLSIAKA